MAMSTSVSVPHGVPSPNVDQRRMRVANAPITPIHTTPSMVMAMLGIGPDSIEVAPMNPRAPAKKAKAITSGSAVSPTQYDASGNDTQAATPAATAGR